jgi:CHAT domain-containing protein
MFGTQKRQMCALLGLLTLGAFAQPVNTGAAALPRQSSDEGVLGSLVDRYFEAYARKALDEMLAIWSSKSPNLEARRKTLQSMFADNDAFHITGLKIRRITVERDRARVRAALEITATGPVTGKPSSETGKLNRTFHFVNDAGKWLIWREESTEDELGAAIEAAKTEEARKSLIAMEREFLSPELASTIARQGIRLRNQSRLPEAMERLELSRSVAEQIGYGAGIASSLTILATCYFQRGDFTRNVELNQKALLLAEKAGDNHLLTAILNNLSLAYREAGEYELAEQITRRGLEVARASNDRRMTAHMLIFLGSGLVQQGNYAAAAKYLGEGLALSEEIGYDLGIGIATEEMGLLYEHQGDYDQALAHLQKEAQKLAAGGDRSAIAESDGHLGDLYLRRGEHEKALQYLQNSLKTFEELGNALLLGEALARLGEAYYAQGDYARAIEYSQRSLDALAPTTDQARTTDSLILLARACYSKGDYPRALQAADRASIIAGQSDSRGQLLSALLAAGLIHRALGQPDPAQKAFEDAIAQAEALRNEVAGGSQEQARFFEDATEPYYAMVSLLMSQDKAPEAFRYAERAKGRVLLDALQHRAPSISKAMTARELEDERGLRIAMASLNAQLRQQGQSPEYRNELKSRLQKARLDYEGFRTRLYAAHPELRTQRGDAPEIDIQQAAALIPDSSTALLEYVVTEDATYLFSLTRAAGETGARLRGYAVAVKRKEVEDLVNAFRQQLASRDLNIRPTARRLYSLLLGPAHAELRGKTTVVIAPDGVLWDLPFQVLVTDANRYIIEDIAISYTPSLTVLREMVARRKAREASPDRPGLVLAVGNPTVSENQIASVRSTRRDENLDPLPEAEREVRTLANLYGDRQATVLIGPDARENRVKNDASKFSVLHFATHGVLDDRAPMYSHLVLAQGDKDEDGLLEAWELMELDLKASLVVLSACQTARGHAARGEGVIGLSWALFVAGCPTAVVSQWKVDSASTTQLMLAFHKYRKSGQPRTSTAAALRKAALDLLKTREHDHPYYWAGFVVVGDGF